MSVEESFVSISEGLRPHEASVEDQDIEFAVCLDSGIDEGLATVEGRSVGLYGDGVSSGVLCFDFRNDGVGSGAVVDVCSEVVNSDSDIGYSTLTVDDDVAAVQAKLFSDGSTD